MSFAINRNSKGSASSAFSYDLDFDLNFGTPSNKNAKTESVASVNEGADVIANSLQDQVKVNKRKESELSEKSHNSIIIKGNVALLREKFSGKTFNQVEADQSALVQTPILKRSSNAWKSVGIKGLKKISSLQESVQRKGSIAFKRGSALLIKARDQLTSSVPISSKYDWDGSLLDDLVDPDIYEGDEPPETIPDGMIWDYDTKRLVYKPPKSIPYGMNWSYSARNGRGMLVYLPPEKIPTGKIWKNSANNGKGALVNLPPLEIKKGYVWSRTAKKGMGGLIKIPPRPGTIPPGKVWSTTAFDGVGGLVNKPLERSEIPDGMIWDNNAQDGIGGLVNERPPAYEIPPGMMWSMIADNGRGKVVFVPPSKAEIPNHMMWSRDANDGKGKLVYKPPRFMPKGKTWDYKAKRGMGALVNLPPKEIPEGKLWSRKANGGKGGLIDKPAYTRENRRSATTLFELTSTLKSERALRRARTLQRKKRREEAYTENSEDNGSDDVFVV
mmetsp:Transcript_2799/g.3777  ORF Transcript_2799/g.3777 Transcript_2799/m.3777 type:complete len:500 (+) Transcript_2799:214-1713(+)|eukprot:CAMPEP_0204872476 /NCGR_PEP_ID=MMETSP1348-20121228/38339_1 /ASSEMBLY_ACC=CAM_ASM_000700 /TAXON_ID=215587 /ORGANISM="Aplanochytrium stocchinoi, Strain GSBS06" /LENGTH=499 /DNA_ID=CAMNT_0052027365 /DNA_START=192 /DNA_END=1691 /DNA_ORIENTATION=-